MTADELRNFLFRELERVSSGEITPAAANASANVSGKVLSSIKLELEYNKMAGLNPKIDFFVQPQRSRIDNIKKLAEKVESQ